jgi:uridine kinase
MAFFDLEEINYRTIVDPKGFVEECDAEYAAKVSLAADRIIENLEHSPVVLLSGPSGSGKTTSAQKIEEELERRGIGSHTVSMDNYFKTVDPETSPRSEDGSLDFESPLCLDLPLFNKQLDQLERGERIAIPKYNFAVHARDIDPSKILKLKKDEIVIFEGIHALNDIITESHPNAFKLYISARSDTYFGDRLIFKGTWLRLMRRTVRDHLFRSYDPDKTIAMWGNVRRGEKLYISPFKNKANLKFDTALKYEAPVMNNIATKLFANIPEGIERYEELRKLLPALQLFGVIKSDLVAPDSLIREFIGGGIYSQ